MPYTVGQVSKLARITVRTLHHYDRIGLLTPSNHTGAGYRLYEDADLERLQQIMLLKELGLSLDDISAAIQGTGEKREEALVRHRRMLVQRQSAIDGLIRLVDRSLEDIGGGRKLDPKEMFDGFDPAQYEEEAKAKYGAKYEESASKTSKYTKKDWEAMKLESKQIMDAIVARMDKGPADAEVTRLISLHRGHITKWFYDCTLEIYRGLADLYIQDARFTKTFEKVKPGLAKFMSDAMIVYVDNEKGKGR